MEQALSEVCKDIRIGKILIQTNWDSGEPELHYLRLPKDIKDYQVILMVSLANVYQLFNRHLLFRMPR